MGTSRQSQDPRLQEFETFEITARSARRSPTSANEECTHGFQHQNLDSRSQLHTERAIHSTNMAEMNNFDPDNMDFSMMQSLYVVFTFAFHVCEPELTNRSQDDLDMDQNLFDGRDGEFNMDMNMFPNMPDVDPSHVWNNAELGFNPDQSKQMQPAPKSAQGKIVDKHDQVVERYGQITPPDDVNSYGAPSPTDASESKRKVQEDIAKKNRTQRARNAANTRHSKSKAARRDNTQDTASEGADDVQGQGKSTNVQREKNRLAAAKCRAKKKATSEDMQENHREGSKKNSYLHREVRELRDQKAFLRNSLLQHEPGICQCHAIHRYNFNQAQQLAMGVGAMIGQPPPLSPSQNSVGSGLTPGSDGSLGGRGVSQMPVAMQGCSSRLHSFSNEPNFGTGQMNGPETYAPSTMSPDQSIPGQFADFVHNSPNGGRPAFS